MAIDRCDRCEINYDLDWYSDICYYSIDHNFLNPDSMVCESCLSDKEIKIIESEF